MPQLTSISLNNSIGVITVNDNLVHKYFSELKWEKDNVEPIGYAQLTMPYTEEISKYWTTYRGPVIVHAQLAKNQEKNNIYNALPNTSLLTTQIEKEQIKKEDNKIRLSNTEYNYSFIGAIYNLKQVGANIVLKIHDLGWKFEQKVPMDFRKSYIAGQSLDDAFQAICEFIGVDFAYSIEDLNQYSFAADGYSIEKDGEIIEEVPTILQEFGKKEDEEDEDLTEDEEAKILESGTGELGALPALSKKNKASIKKANKSSNPALNSIVTNSDEEENKDKNENEDDTKGVDDKIEKYQEEFEDKIKDLFLGNTMYDSNLIDPVLDYGAITIQPKSVASSDMSAVSGGSTSDNSNSTDESQESSNKATSSSFGNKSSRSREKNGWINGQYYINGKIYLSKSYINSLTQQQAANKRASGKNVYTSDTLQKLLWRSMGQKLR